MPLLKFCGCGGGSGEDEASDPPRYSSRTEGKQSSSVPEKPQDSTPDNKAPPTVSNGTTKPPTQKQEPTLAEQLWDRAYNNLRDGQQSKLVREYEKLLSRDLKNGDSDSDTAVSSLDGVENAIDQDNPDRRRAQMRDVIKVGLQKTEKQADTKRVMGAILG
ncbi:hypothetical protein F66182_16544, partial [Fusarium sp. NRRL 66182]